MEIRILKEADFKSGLLAGFKRYQRIERRWRLEDAIWTLYDAPGTVDWDDVRKKQIIESMAVITRNGGCVFGIFEKNALIAFAAVDARRFGCAGEYVQLDMLQVSYGHRGKGLGRSLFDEACRIAAHMGAKKLYISANSAQDTIAFYKKVGCTAAAYIKQEAVEIAPRDCQLEFIINN